MKVFFRTDASVQIGIGHVMRCLTLADALRANGVECIFICREHDGNLLEKISQRGYDAKSLPNDVRETNISIPVDFNKSRYTSWLGVDWSTDAVQTKLAIGEPMVDWIIVDHYAIDVRWESSMRSICRKLMVIDDLADRLHDCDLLLDQNLGRIPSDYKSLLSGRCIILAGPHYALLRPGFSEYRDYSLRRTNPLKAKRLLITMGGIDQGNATGKILEVLGECSLPKGYKITVIMGEFAPWLSQVQLLATQMPWPTEVKINIDNMAELMANSSIAIGAAGSTSWERCCLGLPTLVFSLAENQIQIAKNLELTGACIYLGNLNGRNLLRLRYKLAQLLSSPDEVYNLSKNAHSIVDGLGVERVYQALITTQQELS